MSAGQLRIVMMIYHNDHDAQNLKKVMMMMTMVMMMMMIVRLNLWWVSGQGHKGEVLPLLWEVSVANRESQHLKQNISD